MLPPLPDLIRAAIAAGVAFWLEGETLRIKGPRSASAIGSALQERKAEVVEHLRSAWDAAEAIGLEVAADGEVERHGSRGQHPLIHAAVERVLLAHANQNLPGVRAACKEIARLARELAEPGLRAAS